MGHPARFVGCPGVARLPYDNIEALRAAIIADVPHFALRDSAPYVPGADPQIWNAIGAAGSIDAKTPLVSSVADFYLTNPIARASAVMAECSQLFSKRATKMAAE